MPEPDWYAVLGIGRGASEAQVARAFRRLAFRWHPDRNAGRPELAHQHFLLVHRAYEVLSDPAKRRAYDATHAAASTAVVPAAWAPRRDPPDARRGHPGAPPGPRSAAPPANELLSRGAWLLLSVVIRAVGVVVMLFLGPLAEHRAHDVLRRRAPRLADYVFPLGRVALVAGAVLLGLRFLHPDDLGLHPGIELLAAGGVSFVVERIALASVWALDRGKRRRP